MNSSHSFLVKFLLILKLFFSALCFLRFSLLLFRLCFPLNLLLCQRGLCHLYAALHGPCSSNKACSVNELAIGNAGGFVQIISSEASVVLVNRAPVFKFVLSVWHGLDPEHVSVILEEHELDLTHDFVLLFDVEEVSLPRTRFLHVDEGLAGMEVGTLGEHFLNNCSGGLHDDDFFVDLVHKVLLANFHRLFELLVLRVASILRSIPW